MRDSARALGVIAALSAALLWLLLEPRDAIGAERLENAGFEQWPLSGWTVTGSATQSTSPARTGTSAHLVGADMVRVRQFVEASPSATYAGAIHVTSDYQRPALLRVAFLDSAFVVISEIREERLVGPSGFQALSVSGQSPPGTAYVDFQLTVTAGANAETVAWVDDASLTETIITPPTSTPTVPPPPTATATFVANPTQPPTATVTTPAPTPSPPASAPTATPTSPPAPTSTNTPRPVSPTNTPRPVLPTNTPRPPATSTPRPSLPATSTPVPQPTNTPLPGTPPATATPAPPPFGGLLRNGNFETASGESPAHWQRQGGTLLRTGDAYRGNWAASHLSITSSTKWIHQAVPVTPGEWYAASAWARVQTGSAELFVRVSWYASSDGSGSLLSQEDSDITTSSSWTALSTGAIRAPANARSARVRLMLRPFGTTAAAWDDALFVASAAATPTPIPTASPTVTPRAGSPRGAATATPRSGSGSTGGGSSGGGSSGGGGGSAGGSGTVPITGGEPPQGGALFLSEIMSDPDVQGDNNLNEWVEVYNAGDAPVDLRGWVIADRSRGSTLGAFTVNPGEYVVIAARETELPAGVRSTRVPAGRIGFGLRNPGDAVLLYAPDGTLVDAMSYGDIDLYGPGQPDAPPRGETLGRAFGEDGSPGPWLLTLRPTPGEVNVFPEPDVDEEIPAAGEQSSDEQSSDPLTPTMAPQTADAPVPSDDADGERPPVDQATATSPIAWIVLGLAMGAAVAGSAPFIPAGWRRLKELRKRGS